LFYAQTKNSHSSLRKEAYKYLCSRELADCSKECFCVNTAS
jgi:hypothetical protein